MTVKETVKSDLKLTIAILLCSLPWFALVLKLDAPIELVTLVMSLAAIFVGGREHLRYRAIKTRGVSRIGESSPGLVAICGTTTSLTDRPLSSPILPANRVAGLSAASRRHRSGLVSTG